MSDTPIFDQMVLERAISDPEGVALVEAIHERLLAVSDPHGIHARLERVRAKREALAARPASPGAEVRNTQAVIRAAKRGLVMMFR